MRRWYFQSYTAGQGVSAAGLPNIQSGKLCTKKGCTALLAPVFRLGLSPESPSSGLYICVCVCVPVPTQLSQQIRRFE